MREKRISWNVFAQAVYTIALPIAFQNLLSTTASMVDTIMIGSMGELSVAAVGICSQISSLFFSCYFGFAGGALLFFSQYWGARSEKGINKTFGLSMSFMLLVGLLFGAVAVTKPEFLLGIYTDKKNIIEVAIPYIRIVGFAYPLQVLAVIISFLMRATERVKIPLVSSAVALVVNFVLNWILIYGRFGMPQMGAAGAAVGTLVSGIVNLIILTVFLLKDKKTVTLHVQEMFHWGEGFAGTYLSKCFPILCNELFYGIGQMLINIVIGRVGECDRRNGSVPCSGGLCLCLLRRTGGCQQRCGRQGDWCRTAYEGLSVCERVHDPLPGDHIWYLSGWCDLQPPAVVFVRIRSRGYGIWQVYAAHLFGSGNRANL